jgi:hypothetical protein
MKKISILIILSGLFFQGCDKYLEENPLSKETSETLMESEKGLESLVGGAYVSLRAWYGRENGYDFTEAGTDIYRSGADIRTSGFCNYASALTQEEQFRSSAMWAELYTAINTCNFILSRIDGSPIEDKELLKKRKAEVSYLRAHYYWLIVETWGGVYLSTEPTMDAVHTVTRSSVDDFYQVIFNDLETALSLAPDVPDEYGRISKPVVQAFLARMYLTRGNWAKAKEYADLVIANSNYAFISSWSDLWSLDNIKNSEVIWPVVYSANPTYMTPALRDLSNISAITNQPVLWDNTGIIQREGGNQGLVLWLIRYEEIPNSVWGMARDIENGRGFQRWMPTRFFLDLYNENLDQRWGSFQQVWIANDSTKIPRYKLEETEFYINNVLVPWPISLDSTLFFKVGDTAIVLKKTAVDTAVLMKVKNAKTGKFMPHFVDPEKKYIIIGPDEMYRLNSEGQYAQRKIYFPLAGKYRDNTIASLDVTGSKRDVWVIRLAEMYLIAAEASLNSGDKPSAYDYLLELANNRAVGGDGAALLSIYGVTAGGPEIDIDFILDERARELATEYLRWFDLKRTGKLVERVKAHNSEAALNIQEFHNLRFIPQTQLDAVYNKGEFTQNPGY